MGHDDQDPGPLIGELTPSGLSMTSGQPPVKKTRSARVREAMTKGARWIATSVRARPRRAVSIFVGVALVGIIAPAALRSHGAPKAAPSSSVTTSEASPKSAEPKPILPPAPLANLDLHSIALDDNGAVASAGGSRVAHLTLDPKLQLFVNKLLGKHKLPQAAVVMIEPSTGKVLAYASRDQSGATKDLNVDAFAPSASVFKIMTGAALVQIAGVTPDFKSCYSGGEQKILPSDLKEDPKKDQYCATLAQAMGRSINTIFARLAAKKLNGADLHAIASQLGYGAPIPFDVPVSISKIDIPSDTLGFARTAAGFWNTTLSPLHGALIASTVANGGVMMKPYMVTDVMDGTNVLYKTTSPAQLRKAIDPATAAALEKMMIETVSQGTSYKAFHDAKGKAFLPGIDVAGKTGTLNNPSPVKLYTWFVGYAPVKNPKVAIATLVVNDPVWKVKANVLAREALQAYFAQNGAALVTMPSLD
jgi:penicillin-binding protein A